jgi:predicted transcriptional regulator
MQLNFPDPVQALRDDTKEYLNLTETSQDGLAKLLGVSQQYVSEFIRGERGMSLGNYYN